MKKTINIILAIVIFFIFLYFNFQAHYNAIKLNRINTNYYETQTNIVDLLKNNIKFILPNIVNKKNNIQEIKDLRIILKNKNNNTLIMLFIITIAVILLFLFLDYATYAILISISSLVALSFGIITPILMIVIHKNINHIGDIILSFESKTIIGTISHLYNSHNYPVAIIILLFSVIIPFIKSLLMLLIALFKEFHIANKLISIFKHLGKWSMLDVFVVSLLLVNLSMSSSQNSYSEIEGGLYLFLIYVILSLINSIVIEKLLKETIVFQKKQ